MLLTRLTSALATPNSEDPDPALSPVYIAGPSPRAYVDHLVACKQNKDRARGREKAPLARDLQSPYLGFLAGVQCSTLCVLPLTHTSS